MEICTAIGAFHNVQSVRKTTLWKNTIQPCHNLYSRSLPHPLVFCFLRCLRCRNFPQRIKPLSACFAMSEVQITIDVESPFRTRATPLCCHHACDGIFPSSEGSSLLLWPMWLNLLLWLDLLLWLS